MQIVQMYDTAKAARGTEAIKVVGKDKPYQGTEATFQRATADYLDHMGLLWTHVANERNLGKDLAGKIRGKNLKRAGIKRGVPDVLIFSRSEKHNGCAIELKAGTNLPTKEQIKFLTNLSKCGWACSICYNLDAVIKVVREYTKEHKLY